MNARTEEMRELTSGELDVISGACIPEIILGVAWLVVMTGVYVAGGGKLDGACIAGCGDTGGIFFK